MIRKSKDERLDIVRGSGNIFRDFNDPNPDLEQLRSILAARIIKVLDARKLSVRKAHELRRCGGGFFPHSPGQLRTLTVDRLMSILNRLDQEVEVAVNVHPRVKRKNQREHHPAVSL